MKKEEFEVSHSAILTSLSCGSKPQEPALCKIKGALGLTHADLLNEVKRVCSACWLVVQSSLVKNYSCKAAWLKIVVQSSMVKDSPAKQRG